MIERDLTKPAEAFAAGQNLAYEGMAMLLLSTSVQALDVSEQAAEVLMNMAMFISGEKMENGATFEYISADKAPAMIIDDPNEMFRSGQGMAISRIRNMADQIAIVALQAGDFGGVGVFQSVSAALAKAPVWDIDKYLETRNMPKDSGPRVLDRILDQAMSKMDQLADRMADGADHAGGPHCEDCPARQGCAEYDAWKAEQAPVEDECGCDTCTGTTCE